MPDRRQRGDQDSEVTLSAASLLGIFLGLVLVCGVFFGFGYSIGRRSPSLASSLGGATADQEETDVQAPAAAKPSPARIVETDAAASSAGGDGSSNSSAGGSGLVSLPIAEQPTTVKPADAAASRAPGNNPAGPADTPSAAPSPGPEASASRPEAGRTVVQVAAVSRQEDADVLVSALRQRGYRVIERNEPGDKLLHVQVGPFSSHDEANAMKQKLLADGYNAIIKQ